MLTILFTAVLLAGGLTPPAHAALQAVGPVAAANGFPLWYQDFNGLRLDLCLEPGFCLLEAPDLLAPISFPDNFGPEAFWWSAEAEFAPAAAGVDSALLVLAVEATAADEVNLIDAVEGFQVGFARIRIRIDVSATGTYTVTHPYGTATYNVTALLPAGANEINETQDIGNFLDPGRLGDFSLALADGPGLPEVPGDPVPNISATGASIGPFLRPSATPGGAPLPPVVSPVTGALFIANPLVPTNVTGALPAGGNFFRIQGPGGTVQTDIFSVTGMVSGTQPALLEKAVYRVRTGKFELGGTTTPNTLVTITFGGQTLATPTSDAAGIWTFSGKSPLSPGGAAGRDVTATAGVDTLILPLELR
jgi:hypothetical protein